EAVPFIKTGGLADVAGSLPKALKKQGVDIRVVMPKYGKISHEYLDKMEHVYDGEFTMAWRTKFLGIDKLELDGVTFYFIDNQEYFYREGFYGYGDDAERFAFFSRAALEILPKDDFWPDVIHTNDWHTALVNLYLRLDHIGDARYEKIKTVFTIHNLKYQGVFPKDVMADALGLDWKYFTNGDLEYYDAVNFMKGAIIYADNVTTVSRTYAQEIQYEYFGEGLDGLLRSRAADLHGINNGLDTEIYNPEKDPYLTDPFTPYDADTALETKTDNKVALQHILDLPLERRTPLVAMVTRLVEAKGLDLVVRVLDELLEHENMQFVLLGTGDRVYEDWFRELAWRHPTKVSTNIYFSDEMAQRIYASSSIFLMPSAYEPCGLGQLIAMRYGAIPVVRATGGLTDTVIPYNKAAGEGNGFLFSDYNAHDMMYTIKKALTIYRDLGAWTRLMKNAMQADYSWARSSKEYKALYERLIG
ncbi:MAG: glycogen synthase GlgA, partial [Synergistaceae bacterium]|nr:glycogen synthase GlgA [Synergistaceae bacterium]